MRRHAGGLVVVLLAVACSPNVDNLLTTNDLGAAADRGSATNDTAGSDAGTAMVDIPTTDIPTTDIPTTDIPVVDIPTTDIPVADAGSAPTDSGTTDAGSPCGPLGTACGAVCVETATDPSNCGACAVVCASRTFCAAGRCVATASAPAPALSEARIGAAAVTLADGRALVAGGIGGTPAGYLRSTEIYDPSTNRWSAGPLLPTAVAYASAARGLDGRVYLTGGFNDAGRQSAVYVLDAAAATSWRTVAPMPVARTAAQSAAGRNGRIFVLGGQQGSGATPMYAATLDIYDPVTDRWSAGSPASVGRAYGGAASLADGRVAVFGGVTFDGADRTLSSVEFYDPATDRWTAGPSMPMALQNMGCAMASDGLVHLVGGITGSGLVAAHLAFDPVAGTYRTLAAFPVPLRDLFPLAESPRGALLAAGGRISGGASVATVSSYALAAGAWR